MSAELVDLSTEFISRVCEYLEEPDGIPITASNKLWPVRTN
jgi:hypothetical protein